ncbi:sugar transferase [Sphingomonas sp. CROZ-RG-20F-R02-07]|uniref:sugar transferase n=1 Tax=Sphingomonas sp. CROZ-RG-20F-R02-07 TaxID=2914832 RepID=UPI001F579EC4
MRPDRPPTTVDAVALSYPTRRGSAPRTRRIAIYALLALGDGFALALAFLLGDLVRFGPVVDPSALISLVVMLPIYYGIVVQRKPYSARFFLDWRRTARDSITAFVTAIAVAMFVAVYIHAETPISRSVVPLAGPFGCVLLVASRWALRRLAEAIASGPPIATMMLVDGVAIDAPAGSPVIDAALYDLRADLKDPHALDRLCAAIGGAERVVVACPPARREAWAAALKGANVQGEIVLPELAAIGMLRASRFGECATAVVSLGPLDTMNRLLKRAFDLTVALAALALLWPLLLVVAVAIRIDSPGPILFRQPRMGRGNGLFAILKFRSMRDDLCDRAGDRSTERGDPRITRVGRIIRATSIDELPQLLNVVIGDMSIVGPRPHALGSLAGDRLFWEVDPHYWDRHAIKPGITGLAQVHGFRGATVAERDLQNRLRADVAYMRGWSIWRDIRILIGTAGVVFHRNAF